MIGTVATGMAISGGLLLLDRLALATIRPPRGGSAVSFPDLVGEAVEFPSHGRTLRGTLYASGDNSHSPMVVLAHGWSANAETVLRLGEPLVRAGHPVLTFDFRGHGRSDSAPYVTIRHFRDDVQAAVDYATLRYPKRRRMLVGHSLGGSASILAVAEGADVHGLGVLAAPADVIETTAHYLSHRGLPGPLLARLLVPFWRLRAGQSFRRLRPEDRVQEVRVPVRVVHGSADRRVPVENAFRIAGALGSHPTVVEGAGHTEVLASDELVRAMVELGEAIARAP